MKSIVIGIDVSKEKIDVTAIDSRNPLSGVHPLGYQVFDNRLMGFKRMLAWAKKLLKGITLDDIMFCCETTGGYDRRLCDYICAKGVNIWRESALQIKGRFYKLVSMEGRVSIWLGCLSASRTVSFCFSFSHVARYAPSCKAKTSGTIGKNPSQANL